MDEKIKKLRDEVLQWIEDNPRLGIFGHLPNRSCWECNSAHEYLKDWETPFECFCGHIFYKGIKLTFDDEVEPLI